VWIHAVSVGEGAAALPLISKILERAPETNILVTGGTLAAEEWRRYRYPGSVIRQVREAAQHACKGIQNFKRWPSMKPTRFLWMVRYLCRAFPSTREELCKDSLRIGNQI